MTIILQFGIYTTDIKTFNVLEHNSGTLMLTNAIHDLFLVPKIPCSVITLYNPTFRDQNFEGMRPLPERKSNRQNLFCTLIRFMASNKDL